IASGGRVAFPTETVYGIGCNADDADAVARLRLLKRRPRAKPFTIHLGDPDGVKRHVDPVPPAATKLMRRYWPGPLTVVLPSGDTTVGFRMPSHPIALELLRRAPVPVFAPSANRSGDAPPTRADQVAATLGEGLDLILDGGPSLLGESSTVVRVGHDDWEVLRHGTITEPMLRRTLGTTIVFVCTANMCRSPMAEVLCKQMLAERLGCSADALPEHGYEVLSAGVYAGAESPASAGARAAMHERGLDLSRHCSQPITPALLDDAHAVYCMAQHHVDSILGFFPEAGDKVHLLDPSGADVRDPVDGSDNVFRSCADRIQRHLREVIDTL
ncbi:threonylcarbamoyl-AMP synthase, partial [bacterium]|nr:threonylcarbamoyl-AMP synthase [bacterium]